MDIVIPGLGLGRFRDRRIAASDEYLDGSESRERRLYNSVPAGDRQPRRALSGRFIYGLGTPQRRLSQLRPRSFNVTSRAFARTPEQITTIVLHSTRGRAFQATDLPNPMQDTHRGSYHRVDEIIAHFVIFQDGTVVYTHDIQYILNCAGKRKGIDIEFAGRFSHDETISSGSERLSTEAILSGRALIRELKLKYLNNLNYIHPHGQVQSGARGGRGNGGKFDICSGPDVWVNVGEWAVNTLGLTCETTDSGYPNHTISELQSNPAYRQTV